MRYSFQFYLWFILLALAASLGLDLISARRGEKAYFFSVPAPEAAVFRAPSAWTQAVLRRLEESGVPAGEVQRLKDEEGAPCLAAALPQDAYEKILPEIEAELRQSGVSILIKQQEEEDRIVYSWLLEGKEKERLSLIFSCPRPQPEETQEAPPPPPGDTVAIIIDDMGNSLDVLQELIDLETPLTISVLPFSAYAEETARLAHENGLEVMLHLPGESLNDQEDYAGTTGMIRSGMKEYEIRALVEESLAMVPYVRGVNNHMGSKITQEEAVMRPILDMLKKRNLFFIDSRTTAQSIAYDLARRMGLRAAYRHVFLDSTVGVDFSRKKMTELFRLSQKNGSAIAIAHPFPETLQALKENIHLLKEYNIRPVLASRIIPD
jgi:polysaccharide deacetylase 2 family uncharacterized protein YibQ